MSEDDKFLLAKGLCNVVCNSRNLRCIEIGEFGFDSLYYYVEQDEVLGISKKSVYKLYYSLREELRAVIARKFSLDDPKVMDLTLVALLITYEHISCINIRKQVIANKPDQLLEELRILNIIFSSRLDKQTKSPSLWQHRRWVLGQLGLGLGYELDVFVPLYQAGITLTGESKDDLKKPDTLHKNILFLEIEQVILAGERHPTNYYAWSHARWVVDTYAPSEYDAIILADTIFKACKTLVSDISRWSFLFFVLMRIKNKSITSEYLEKAKALDQLAPRHGSINWFITALSKQ